MSYFLRPLGSLPDTHDELLELYAHGGDVTGDAPVRYWSTDPWFFLSQSQTGNLHNSQAVRGGE